MSAPSDGNLPIGKISDLFPHAKPETSLGDYVKKHFEELSQVVTPFSPEPNITIQHFQTFEVTLTIGTLDFFSEVTALTKEIAEAEFWKHLEQVGVEPAPYVTVEITEA